MSPQSASSPPSDLSVAVLVLNWNGRSLLESGLPLLLNQTYPNRQIVVVDNGSTDGSIELVQERFPQVKLIQHGENIGFSRALNAGMRQVEADVLVLLNNDVFAEPDWLAEMMRPFYESSEIGIVGSKLLFPDGTIQHLGAELSYPLGHSQHLYYKQDAMTIQTLPEIQDMAYVTGAALAIHRAVKEKIGLLDGMFHPIYYEEVDYCYRARAAGFQVVVATKSVAIHDESTSMKRLPDVKLQMLHRNRYRFLLKHYSVKQLLEDFVPAETAYLNQQRNFSDVNAIRLACLEMAILAPTILSPELPPEKVTAVQNALLQLRQTAVMATASQTEPPPPLEEFSFPQSLIGRLRDAWSSIAAKWLMRNLLQQQNLQNNYLQRRIAHLNIQAQSQAMEIEHLMNTVLSMQQTQQQLQDELAQLKKQLADAATESTSSR
ncbi:glycosyltransferase family 2 protein [Candidatus Leptofilum sp.]|uniref:glycosyltransferase family 2 protein n=1 Tax=Candidatus Leptofilum sp. TaxID=3241576 RepID=UPI003B5C5AB3